MLNLYITEENYEYYTFLKINNIYLVDILSNYKKKTDLKIIIYL